MAHGLWPGSWIEGTWAYELRIDLCFLVLIMLGERLIETLVGPWLSPK